MAKTPSIEQDGTIIEALSNATRGAPAADRDDVKHWVTYTGKNGPNNFSVNAMRSRNCLSFLILENGDWFL